MTGWSGVECQLSSEENKIDDGMAVESMVGWAQECPVWGGMHPSRQCCLLHHGMVRRAVQDVGVAHKVVRSIIVCTSLEEFVLQGHLGIVLQ